MHELEDLVTRTNPGEVNLELGYSTGTRSERDTVYLPARKQANRLGLQCQGSASTVPPAEKPTESAAKKRQYDRTHRSKERDDCATRTSATGGWPGRD